MSGGQRQRLAIARVLICAPRVLIQALDRLMAGRTTFIVAHRLSTLRKAGRIAVLDAGRLVEIGPPDELLRCRGGAFARLHALQTLAAAG